MPAPSPTAHHLQTRATTTGPTTTPAQPGNPPQAPKVDELDRELRTLETEVLRLLADAAQGTASPIGSTAHDGDELLAASALYREAGRAALAEARRAAQSWWQVRVRFTDWDRAEHHAATALAPVLARAESDGVLTSWWYLRKHPNWRLRFHAGHRPDAHRVMTALLGAALDDLTNRGLLQRWWETRYEPETHSFGGTAAMTLAHTLFHADSRATLAYLAHPRTAGRRELSIILCSSLLLAARLDPAEQGDVWHRVADLRPLTTPPHTVQLAAMAAPLRALIAAAHPTAVQLLPDADVVTPWVDALTTTGRGLADLARDGRLDRGLRHVLANHIIFHWNRLGLPTHTQAVLARAARAALLP